MTIRCLKILTSLAVSLGVTASACNVHDNNTTINIPNATINATTTADVSNVMPGQDVAVMATVENVFLIEPAVTPPAEHMADAGHIQVYLDDTTTPPLLITAQVAFNVTIPPATPAGRRKLICRVHKHDGTPTNTKFEINITIMVSGTPSDAQVTVDVNINNDVNAAPDANATADASAPDGG